MVRSRGLLWKAPSGIEAISLLWNPLRVEGKEKHMELQHE